MEQLNKQQIILLALLVSFVSSIATGITVISLVSQDSPATVTQTINRVVERTIEKVSGDPAAKAETKETIIVHDDQAAVNAIEKVSKAIVRIYWSDSYGGSRFVGLGVIVDASGKIMAKADTQYGGSFVGYFDGGNIIPLTFVSRDSLTGLSLFQAQQGTSPADMRAYSAADFADSKAAKIGQSVILISGSGDPVVATGVVSSIRSQSDGAILTNVRDPEFSAYAVLVNLSGEVLGERGAGSFADSFVPSNTIKTYATP